MPPMKIYEALQQANPGDTQNNYTGGKPGGDLDFFKQDKEEEKKDDISAFGGQSEGKGSPQKSLAIRGPPKIIDEKLEIENYRGVKVLDINVRPINQSVAVLRAQKEMSSLGSHRMIDKAQHSRGHSGLHQSNSQQLQAMSHAGTDNGSRIVSAEQLEQAVNPQQAKSIISFLNDKITTFLMSSEGAELKKQIMIDGDLVTSFFDGITSENDGTLLHFLEEIKKEFEVVLQILGNSANEMIVFMTYLLLMLKKLHPSDLSFVVITQLVKGLARDINDENGQFSHQYQLDFNKFFMAHLLRNYCSIIIESAVKRQPVCELIYAHCQHDLQMRIKVVQSLKKHLKQDEVVYACHAFLIANEDSFNE